MFENFTDDARGQIVKNMFSAGGDFKEKANNFTRLVLDSSSFQKACAGDPFYLHVGGDLLKATLWICEECNPDLLNVAGLKNLLEEVPVDGIGLDHDLVAKMKNRGSKAKFVELYRRFELCHPKYHDEIREALVAGIDEAVDGVL